MKDQYASYLTGGGNIKECKVHVRGFKQSLDEPKLLFFERFINRNYICLKLTKGKLLLNKDLGDTFNKIDEEKLFSLDNLVVANNSFLYARA